MKRFLFIIMAMFCSMSMAFADTINVPQNTLVPIELQEDISSRKLKADDLVPVTVIRDVTINDKVVFKQGAKGYLRVFDCVKVDTWGSNWRNGATMEFDGAEIEDANGTMRKFTYNEKFKGADIVMGSSVSAISNAYTTGKATYSSPYGYGTGTAKYNENTNTMNSAFVNGHRFTGENILIKKGKRFKIGTAETFKFECK